VGQFHFTPERYLELMHSEVPQYERMQDEVAAARRALAAHAVQLHAGRLEDAPPPAPFDLVLSALAVHHLNAAGKAELFARIASVLRPGGRFVLADVVVPDDPADAVTPLDPGFDLPDTVPDQLRGLAEAGLEPRTTWASGDVAVIAAELAAA
jgi:tRNA (cmo5U34)-methyltransferase